MSNSTLAGVPVPVQTLVAATRSMSDQVEDVLGGAGISVPQWIVMLHLYENRGCTISELSDASGVAGATMTRMVDRLTSSALAHRNVDPTDRRRALVHLSQRGRSMVRQLLPAVRAAEADSSALLSPDEQALLDDLLGRIINKA